jgi:hypothetical protein
LLPYSTPLSSSLPATLIAVAVVIALAALSITLFHAIALFFPSPSLLPPSP